MGYAGKRHKIDDYTFLLKLCYITEDLRYVEHLYRITKLP